MPSETELKEMKEMLLQVLSLVDEDVAAYIASAYWNIFKELIDHGFNADQAIQICSRMDFSPKVST